MSVAQLTPSMTRDSSRWLLLGSLALNLFFIGVAIAMTVRGPEPARNWDPDVMVRAERIADSLPASDAALLRAQIGTNRAAIEAAQAKYRSSQDNVRATLRAVPFNEDAMRSATASTRASRLAFDETIQGVFNGAAAQMSQNGRQALADWPPGRKSTGARP
jgi:uncharacterized membrane protein